MEYQQNVPTLHGKTFQLGDISKQKNQYPLSTNTTQPVIRGPQPQMGKVEITFIHIEIKLDAVHICSLGNVKYLA